MGLSESKGGSSLLGSRLVLVSVRQASFDHAPLAPFARPQLAGSSRLRSQGHRQARIHPLIHKAAACSTARGHDGLQLVGREVALVGENGVVGRAARAEQAGVRLRVPARLENISQQAIRAGIRSEWV